MKLRKLLLPAIIFAGSVAAHADGIEWSGFGSLYYSQAFDQQMLPTGYSSNKMDFTSNSLIGFNVSSKINENTSFTSQIIATGGVAQSTNFNLYAQWAALTYSFNNSLNVKIGRQLLPILISSEYSKVHYLLPGTKMPSVVYGSFPFVSLDGLSLNKTFDVGFASLLTSVYAGTPNLDIGPVSGFSFKGSNLAGARAALEGSGWKVQLNALKVHSNITAGPVSSESDTKVFSGGYKIDKNNFVSWGEMVYAKSSNFAVNPTGPNIFLDKDYGWYVLGGYRVAKFLPYVSVGESTSAGKTAFSGKVTSYTFGTNYQLDDHSILKFDYQRLYVPSIGGGNHNVIQSATASHTKYGDAVSAGIDFIF